MQTMYPGKVNSPTTILDGGINDVITTINVINGSVLPVSPNIAVIGTEVDAETILYANRLGNVLSNVTRGFQGVAKAWSSGESIARLFTEYDYASLKANLATLEGRKITDFAAISSSELAGKITDELGVGKLMFGTEGEWTPALNFGGASVGMTYAFQEGFYTKIGRVVTVTCRVELSSKGTSTGNLGFTGLPFTNKDAYGAISTVSLFFNKITFANVFEGFIGKNSNNITIRELTEGGFLTTLTEANFSNDSGIYVMANYFTD